LMRPPSHHVTPTVAMGFCYFDRDRAHYALATGCERDWIWDFDGYEEIQTQQQDSEIWTMKSL
jgi:acetoin utilization deacetylase AcuC-like enzyme